MDNSPNIQNDSIPNNGPKKHKRAAIAGVVVLVAFLIFVFIAYKGYIPSLNISAAVNPYYSVANVQQLSSTISKLQNSSAPFNLSYSLLLSLSARAGASTFSFNLPFNGYIAHYKPYTRATTDIDLGMLVKDIGSLSKSINISSFPKLLDNVNLTLLSNVSHDTICVPFSMIASLTNKSLAVIGYSLNDSKINNESLLCVSLNASGFKNFSAMNISNISQISQYLQIKYQKSESYNGNSCSLLDINTTPAFESKYNASMGFSFCFSNVYGMPLYGNFIINLTKDSSAIGKLLNSSSGGSSSAPNFSNIILSAALKSSFNPAPSSASSLSSLPVGSYTMSQSMLLGLIASAVTPSITVGSSGFR